MCTTIKLRLKKHQSKKSSRNKYDTAKLENENYLKAFTLSLKNRYQVLENNTPAKEDAHEQSHICRQLFVGHVVALAPMRKKETLHRMINFFITLPSS